jgi:hypothetical protein
MISPLAMIKPLIHLCFTLGFILKIVLEHCDSYSLSFSQKATKFHARSSFFNISHFNFKKITKHILKHFEKNTRKYVMQDAAQCHLAD